MGVALLWMCLALAGEGFGVSSTLRQSQTVSRGATLSLNGIDYFVPPSSQGSVSADALKTLAAQNNDGDDGSGHFYLAPVSIVSSDATQATLSNLFNQWAVSDDVWTPGFLQTVFVSDAVDSTALEGSCNGVTVPAAIPGVPEGIPSGPYFINRFTGDLYQAYRLYDDYQATFLQSLLQSADGSFQTVGAKADGSSTLSIGVPSRLYFQRTAEKPLAGVRVGVKDLFDLKGIRTSRGSRAYYELYGPSSATATPIQHLIDAGAIIVGVQKLAQFANGEVPTADWVSYVAPFNPRGDGYQDPASSSSGAGSSVASYAWLDVAVGSDTGGSIRGPAHNTGVFGNRPSHGLVSLENVMPLAPQLDTPGLLARDAQLWDAAQAVMYGKNYRSFKTSEVTNGGVVMTLNLPSADTPEGILMHKFVQDLATFVHADIVDYDLDAQWASTGPADRCSVQLTDFFNLTYSALIAKEQTKLLRDPFYKDYADAHGGRTPFIDPPTRIRWAWSDTQPDSILAEAVQNKTLFMDWFNREVLPTPADLSQCAQRILIDADSTGSFSRRDVYRSAPGVPFGWSNGEISCFAECPDSVYPIGEAPYFSEITNHIEYLPVSVDILVPKYCDGVIPKLAQELQKANILPIQQVGSTISGGVILQ